VLNKTTKYKSILLAYEPAKHSVIYCT